jgi:electron transfer flavoprotein beta subunit
MKIVVPIKLVPDLVEELEIDASGKALDLTWMRMVINELDNHAIEQAILLKETHGAEVIVIAPDFEDTEDVLFTAAAAGADRLIKLTGLGQHISSHVLANACAPILSDIKPDLVLTGVQAHDDIDGQLGPILAEMLGMPFIGYIAGISLSNGTARLNKEYPGGLVAVMGADLPLVVGIQAADQPPRYIAFSRVRQARNTYSIKAVPVAATEFMGGAEITRMVVPERGEGAQMITGSIDEITDQVLEIIKEHGIG